MTRIELEPFRAALESIQAGSINKNRESLTIEASPDELDRIQHAGERDYAMGTLERDSSRLREVRDALRRMNAGKFGICIVCEDNIHPRRLAAVPWASSCIVCQEAAERGHSEIRETSLVMAA